MTKQKISVITVCYNEKENILPMYGRLSKVFEELDYDYEIIYVDNSSTDDSNIIFEQLAKKDSRVKVILMSRNTNSSQYSYLAGIKLASGDAAVLIDGDIQDPPELIVKFIEKWRQGYDVVYGVRKKRKDTILRRFFYKLFYRVFRKLSYIDIPLDAGDFSLLDRKVLDYMKLFEERDYYVRGLRAYAGFNQIGVEYVRDGRERGKTRTTLFSYLWYAKTLIVNFSFKPLEWIAKIAFFFMFASFVLIVFEIVLYFMDPSAPRGIPTIVMLVLFIGAIQLLCMSIIAEYLAKIFFEIKRRPRYIVKDILNASKEDLDKISE